MNKNRLEAFSDGVLAIIITIMVLELKIPHGAEWEHLAPIWPKFISYILSFIYVGIYWNNHHYLLHTVKHVSGGILWANANLLFWLSLVPFATAWAGENHFAQVPVVLYGILLLAAAISYFILSKAIITHHGRDSMLAQAIGKDIKGILSVLLYLVGILVAYFSPMLSCGFYVLVAIIWLIPDKRIERQLV